MSQESQKPDHWRDRLVERALEERLGGETPPDLSAQILSAAEATPSTGDVTMATTTASRTWGIRNWVLAASVLVNVGLFAALFASRSQPYYLTSASESVKENRVAADPEATLGETGANKDGYNWQRANEEAAEEVRLRRYSGEKPQEPLREEAEEGGGQNSNGEFNNQIDAIPSVVKVETWSDGSSESKLRDSKLNLNAYGRGGEGQQSAGQQIVTDGGSVPGVPATGGRRRALEKEAEGEIAEFTGDLKVPSRQDSFSTFDVQLGSIPQPSESPIGYPEQEKWDELSRSSDGSERGRGVLTAEDKLSSMSLAQDGRYARAAGRYDHFSINRGFDSAEQGGDRSGGQWGFQGGRGENNIGLQGLINTNDMQWQGSPDGLGLGPGAAGDRYERIHENRFIPAIGEEAVSTFSIDVDTASYANMRQMLTNGQVPPPDSVRLEELVNYFDYDYEPPRSSTPSPSPSPQVGGEEQDPFGPKFNESEVPFAAHVETAGCPWQPGHRLVRVAIKGREISAEKRPLSNLVFLVDVSGSMNNPEKLPLVKHGLKKLAEKLGENDRVAIVVYASSEGLALPSTPGTEQETILAALENLQAGGSTAGGAGIQLAYQIAEDNFITGGTNRVILCTDGDFNVGLTNTAELERMVEQKAKDTGVFLSCIGFGRGNLNDAMMEKITGIGNGNYYYADDEREAERIFVKGMTGMLVTIAKDVKIQVEFNPAKVLGYRLLGYENRMLKTEDFNDDTKDAGEIGAGHTVTCLYEIVPTGEKFDEPDVDDLKYQHPAGLTDAAETEELLTLKMRYKQPDEDTSSKLEWPVTDSGHRFGEATTDMQFASAVASFGMLLRDSLYKGQSSYDAVIEIAYSSKGDDPEGDRAEFVELVRKAKQIMLPPTQPEAEANPEDSPSEEAPAEQS